MHLPYMGNDSYRGHMITYTELHVSPFECLVYALQSLSDICLDESKRQEMSTGLKAAVQNYRQELHLTSCLVLILILSVRIL